MNTQAIDIEIDWNIAASDEPTLETPVDPRIAADASPPPGAVPLSTFAAPVRTSQECADIIEAERSVLGAAGIATDDGGLLFSAGTALAQSGHDALARYDAEYRALPDPDTAVSRFRATIEREQREDHTRDLAHMRINGAGRLASESLIDQDELGINVGPTAWRQLVEIAGSQNVNAGLHKRTRAERRIRTRLAAQQGPNEGARREAFGIVSTDPARGYAVFDGPQVADLVLRAFHDRGLASGAKMTVDYDRDSTRYDIRAIVQAPIDIPAFSGVGRVHQLFARVTGGDDGMASVRGGLGALRIRCLNATLCEARGATWTKTHRGSANEIRHLVAGMVDQFGDVAEELRSVWARAAASHYLDAATGTTLGVREALERLVAHGHLPTGGLEADQAVDNFLAAWRAEDSPTSAAGVLMAVQRAAHESTWKTRWGSADLETAASNLLYQPVWTLDEVVA